MIEIIFLDVDGCLTDGGLYYTNSGDEFKKFDVKDGFAIEQWIKSGKKIAIITGKISKIVEKRANDLKINFVYQGVKNKLEIAKQILKEQNLSFENAAAIGDDYNDIKLLNSVKFSFQPKNAIKCLTTNFKLKNKGGCGAVREMIEKIIELNGQKDEWINKWL